MRKHIRGLGYLPKVTVLGGGRSPTVWYLSYTRVRDEDLQRLMWFSWTCLLRGPWWTRSEENPFLWCPCNLVELCSGHSCEGYNKHKWTGQYNLMPYRKNQLNKMEIMFPQQVPCLLEHRCVNVSHFSPVQFFATLWTVAHQAPLYMGFPRQECLSGLPFPPTGVLPNPGIKLGSPVFQADSLPSESPGKPFLLFLF